MDFTLSPAILCSGQGCQNDDSLVRAMNTAMLSGDEFAARLFVWREMLQLFSRFFNIFNFIGSRSCKVSVEIPLCQLCCAKLGVLMNRKKSGRLSKAQDWQS
jgi:hypothetical protein